MTTPLFGYMTIAQIMACMNECEEQISSVCRCAPATYWEPPDICDSCQARFELEELQMELDSREEVAS